MTGDLFGDVELQAARRAMMDAVNATEAAAQRRHRHTAEGKLRDAYELFTTGSEVTGMRRVLGKVLGQYSSQVRVRHGKAYIAAASVALILRPEDPVGCRTWATNAQSAFNRFRELTEKEFASLANGHERAAARYRSTPLLSAIPSYEQRLDPQGTHYVSVPTVKMSTEPYNRAKSDCERAEQALWHMTVLARAQRGNQRLMAEFGR